MGENTGALWSIARENISSILTRPPASPLWTIDQPEGTQNIRSIRPGQQPLRRSAVRYARAFFIQNWASSGCSAANWVKPLWTPVDMTVVETATHGTNWFLGVNFWLSTGTGGRKFPETNHDSSSSVPRANEWGEIYSLLGSQWCL